MADVNMSADQLDGFQGKEARLKRKRDQCSSPEILNSNPPNSISRKSIGGSIRSSLGQLDGSNTSPAKRQKGYDRYVSLHSRHQSPPNSALRVQSRHLSHPDIFRTPSVDKNGGHPNRRLSYSSGGNFNVSGGPITLKKASDNDRLKPHLYMTLLDSKLSGSSIPSPRNWLPHLRILLKNMNVDCVDNVAVDSQGCSIFFADTDSGRDALDRCAKLCIGQTLFAWPMQVQPYMLGRKTAQIDSSGTGRVGASGDHGNDEITLKTDTESSTRDDLADSRNGEQSYATKERVEVNGRLSNSLLTPLITTPIPKIVELRRTNDSEFARSPSPSEFSVSSSRRENTCQKCKKPATGFNRFIQCSTCRRKYHEACGKAQTTSNQHNTLSWICFHCFRKGRSGVGSLTSTPSSSVSPVLFLTKTGPNGEIITIMDGDAKFPLKSSPKIPQKSNEPSPTPDESQNTGTSPSDITESPIDPWIPIEHSEGLKPPSYDRRSRATEAVDFKNHQTSHSKGNGTLENLYANEDSALNPQVVKPRSRPGIVGNTGMLTKMDMEVDISSIQSTSASPTLGNNENEHGRMPHLDLNGTSKLQNSGSGQNGSFSVNQEVHPQNKSGADPESSTCSPQISMPYEGIGLELESQCRCGKCSGCQSKPGDENESSGHLLSISVDEETFPATPPLSVNLEGAKEDENICNGPSTPRTLSKAPPTASLSSAEPKDVQDERPHEPQTETVDTVRLQPDHYDSVVPQAEKADYSSDLVEDARFEKFHGTIQVGENTIATLGTLVSPLTVMTSESEGIQHSPKEDKSAEDDSRPNGEADSEVKDTLEVDHLEKIDNLEKNNSLQSPESSVQQTTSTCEISPSRQSFGSSNGKHLSVSEMIVLAFVNSPGKYLPGKVIEKWIFENIRGAKARVSETNSITATLEMGVGQHVWDRQCLHEDSFLYYLMPGYKNTYDFDELNEKYEALQDHHVQPDWKSQGSAQKTKSPTITRSRSSSRHTPSAKANEKFDGQIYGEYLQDPNQNFELDLGSRHTTRLARAINKSLLKTTEDEEEEKAELQPVVESPVLSAADTHGMMLDDDPEKTLDEDDWVDSLDSNPVEADTAAEAESCLAFLDKDPAFIEYSSKLPSLEARIKHTRSRLTVKGRMHRSHLADGWKEIDRPLLRPSPMSRSDPGIQIPDSQASEDSLVRAEDVDISMFDNEASSSQAVDSGKIEAIFDWPGNPKLMTDDHSGELVFRDGQLAKSHSRASRMRRAVLRTGNGFMAN